MCFNRPGSKPNDNIALKILLKIAHIFQVGILFHKICFFDTNDSDLHIKLNKKHFYSFQRANKVNDFVDILMTGLDAEADDTVVSNTILVLQAILQNMSECLTLSSLKTILEQVLAELISASRQKVKAALGFLLTFIKTLPASYVATHLPDIVRTMSAMKPDTKRFYRKNLGFAYKRLCKRFTPEEIVALVPGNDEITHKKLKNIRKALARSKRKAASEHKDESDTDDDDDGEIRET